MFAPYGFHATTFPIDDHTPYKPFSITFNNAGLHFFYRDENQIIHPENIEWREFANRTAKMIRYNEYFSDKPLSELRKTKTERGDKKMDMEMKIILPDERKYTYRQSQQISMQTGFIGYLRADFGSSGKEFFSSWYDFRKDLKTDEFKAEFDDVINSLRDGGGVLSGRGAMSKYCFGTPESSFENDRNEYGVRVDTEKHAYLMRLNPRQGEYNLYCYCYEKQWLDRHISQAEKGIRFIDPHYKELFRIPDGDKIRITLDNGEPLDRECRYIDEYHLEVGNNLYHICEFAERMEQAGNTVIPLRSSLPEQCYVYVQTENEIGIVKKGKAVISKPILAEESQANGRR